MVRIDGVSSYPGFELSGLNCMESNTPKPRRVEIWFELAGVRVTEVIITITNGAAWSIEF